MALRTPPDLGVGLAPQAEAAVSDRSTILLSHRPTGLRFVMESSPFAAVEKASEVSTPWRTAPLAWAAEGTPCPGVYRSSQTSWNRA